MKIITSSTKTKLSLSKKEWVKIGKTAGWLPETDKAEKLKEALEQAKSVGSEISQKLKENGYNIEKVTSNGTSVFIKRITDSEGNEHTVDIEIKPWANKNNKKFELRGGVFIMAGPYAHKKFRRKRFSPKKIDSVISFINSIIKYSNDMDRLRKRRSEKAEKARAEKFEAAYQQSLNPESSESAL
jgi:hypothetical protein